MTAADAVADLAMSVDKLGPSQTRCDQKYDPQPLNHHPEKGPL